MVLSEYREKLHDWLRLALRKDVGGAKEGLNAAAAKLTYGMWISLMDGPDPEQQKGTPPTLMAQTHDQQPLLPATSSRVHASIHAYTHTYIRT